MFDLQPAQSVIVYVNFTSSCPSCVDEQGIPFAPVGEVSILVGGPELADGQTSSHIIDRIRAVFVPDEIDDEAA